MGDVKKYLSKGKLPERERHNSRLFIDLAENIHIHHREFRTVFSIDEFLEYTDVIVKSREELISYLENNPDYREMKYPTTIFVSGGREQQLKYLQNSPEPNKSSYYNDDIAIELQEEYVADEVHIHYRDFRIVCNRNNFKEIAKHFNSAYGELIKFENSNKYERQSHPDSDIKNFNKQLEGFFNSVKGAIEVDIRDIKSYWYKDITKEMKPDKCYINNIIKTFENNDYITPIVISTEKDGTHYIIDGHHRYYSAVMSGKKKIGCVVIDLPFIKTKKIRDAEVALKNFDKDTEYKYNLSGFLKTYISMKLNKFYFGNFYSLNKEMSKYYIFKRKIISLVFGKKKIFFSFFEKYRK